MLHDEVHAGEILKAAEVRLKYLRCERAQTTPEISEELKIRLGLFDHLQEKWAIENLSF